jgi:hypothetical protein
MPLELWIGHGGHFFVDIFPFGQPVQVGQAFQEKADGPWTIEVNDAYLTAPDLETAKRLFVEKYDRALVKLSPGAFDGEPRDLSEGYTIVDLSRLQKLGS